uniref:Ribonuclease H-like domain-containing protein n=1 Tax=Tanacetum cinerariifolium TaxID=118510 RepID=A0A6L2M991_TANCI|nr:ribonuclease H-like domain-containing protein [Tanacetum cinerariifolium]
MNTDHNLWKVIQIGNSKKSFGRDSKGGIIILSPVSFKEHVVVQRETKARTLLLQSLPEDYMADFHHLDDAREIWLAAKPDNDDVNLKFLRTLPPSWSQVARTLKTRGGLEYLSFDDLYNKLRSFEIDVKGGSSYGSRVTVAPTYSAFIGATSTTTKMEHKPEEGEQVYGLMARFKSDFTDLVVNAAGSVYDAAAEFAMIRISPKVQTCPFDCDSKLSELKKNYAHLETMYNDSFIQVQAYKNTVKTLELQKDWYHKTQLALEEKEVKLVESLARFNKWKSSSKNLAKLINSSLTTKTKLGLGFKEYFGSDEVFDLSTPSIFDPEPVTREVKSLYERFVKAGDMHEVPPSITGIFMPTSSNSVLEETQVTFGSKSPTSNNTSESNDFVSCDNIDVKILSKSDVKDPSPTNGVSNCSIKKNVQPLSVLCNKCRIADNFPSVVLKASSIPAGSMNSSASTSAGRSILAASRNRSASIHAGRSILAASRNRSASIHAGGSISAANRNRSTSIHVGRSIPAASRNRPSSIHAGRHIPAGRSNKPAPFLAGRTIPTGWINHATRLCFGPTNLCFDNVYWPDIYNHMSMNEGRWGSAVKSSADIGIVDSGSSRSMTGNKEKLADFVQVKGGLVTFGGGDGLPLKLFTNKHNCVACNKGKQHKASYKAVSAVRTISEPLQLLYMDLFGPTSIKSIDHKYYSLVVTDDFSRFCWAFFLGTKDETFYILKDFIALIENQLNKKEKGIKRDYSNARTPQQNGVVERKNRTLIEAARSMLADSKLPTMFWTEAVSTACYVLNRVSITNPHNKTQYELPSGKIPNIRHLKHFGCQVTILNTSDHLGKFKGKANDGFLVVYAAHSKAYRVYNLSSKKVEETLNLRYLEDKPNIQGLGQEWYFHLDYLTDSLGYTRFKTNTPAGTDDTNILAGTQADDSDSECDEHVILVPSFPSNSFSGPTVQDVSAPMENNLDYAKELARFQRQEYEAHSAAVKHGFEFSVDTAALLPQANIEIHRNLVPAAGDPAAGIVPTGGVIAGRSIPASSVPTGRVLAGSSIPASSVPSGGVLAGSSIPASSVPTGRFLVGSSIPTSSVLAGGILADSLSSTNSAAGSVPAASVFIPAVVPTDSAANSLLPPVHSLGSYSNVAVDPVATKRQVWKLVPLPAGKIAIGTKWILKNKRDARGIVVRNKARLVAQGHRQEEGIDYDEVYVDDIIFGSTNKASCDEFEVLMKGEFEMSAMDKYVKNMLKKFDMDSVRTATTPYEVPKHKSKDEPDDVVNVYLFRSMTGSLMYLTASRPDIMFAVSACSRYQVSPLTSHLNAVKKIFKYLKGQPNLGLWYPQDSPFQLEAYSDIDYVGSHGDRKSTTGGCQFLGRRLISWQCKKQTVVATSSTEAEYVAAASCCGQCHVGCSIYLFQMLAGIQSCRLVLAGSYSFLPFDWFLLVVDDYNKVAYLEKGKGWEDYEPILAFLNRSHIRYALTHRPTIVFDSLVKQFWATATVRTLEAGPSDIIATIDGNKVVVTESLIKTQLQLDDVNGLYEFTLHDVLDGMRAIGYPTDGSLTFYKAKLLPQWRFLIHTLIYYMSPKSRGDGPHMPLLAPMLVVPAGGDAAGAAANAAAGPGPSSAPQVLPVRDHTPVRVPSPMRDPTLVRDPSPHLEQKPTPDSPSPPSPPPSSATVGPTTSSRPPSPSRHPSVSKDIREGGGDFASSPQSNEAPQTLAVTAAGGAEDSTTLTVLSLKLDRCLHRVINIENELGITKKVLGGAVLKLVTRVKRLEGLLQQRKRRLVLSDSEGEDATTTKQEFDLAALHTPASATLGDDSSATATGPDAETTMPVHSIRTTRRRLRKPFTSSVSAHVSKTIPAGVCVPAASTTIPTSRSVDAAVYADAAPSSSFPTAADKGKAPMVDDCLPADLLSEQERVLKNLYDSQLGEELAKKIHAEQEAEFARQQEELAQKAQAESVTSPTEHAPGMSDQRRQELDDAQLIYTEADWLDLLAKIATNFALSNQGWTMKKVKALSLAQLRLEFEYIQKHLERSNLLKFRRSTFHPKPTLDAPPAKRATQGAPPVLDVSSQDPAGVPATPLIPADVSLPAATSSTPADIPVPVVSIVHAVVSVLAEPMVHPAESHMDPPLTAPAHGSSEPTVAVPSPSSLRHRRKHIAMKRVTPIVDVADAAMIKFDSSVHAYNNMTGHTKHFTTLREILHMVERTDLQRLLGAVDALYQSNEPDTFALLLWGDLHVLFQSLDDADALQFWRTQDSWCIRSWRLYLQAQVHVLEMVDGRVIHMFVDVSYPLSVGTLERIMKHRFEVSKLLVGGDLTMAEQLIGFIKAALLNAKSAD